MNLYEKDYFADSSGDITNQDRCKNDDNYFVVDLLDIEQVKTELDTRHTEVIFLE